MASNNLSPATEIEPAWRAAGLRYHAYGYALKRRFGQRVQRVSIDAGFTCPNVDGTVAKGGCVFCDNRSFSPSRRLPRTTILGQIDAGIMGLKRRYRVDRFIAYFQPATNTYAPVERLRPLFTEAISHSDVVGLAIGTRSDCVGPEVMDLLSELAEETYLSVEYGMQTMHNRSLDWMNRGHHHDAMIDAVERSRGRGFEISAHAILGLPGESDDEMRATARELARLDIDAVKIHNLYAVKNTQLGDEVLAGRTKLMSREHFVSVLVDFLELLPPRYVVERVSGEAPPDFFVGPSWCQDKSALLAAIDQEFQRRDSYQGLRYQTTS